jgi:hypothetical protein
MTLSLPDVAPLLDHDPDEPIDPALFAADFAGWVRASWPEKASLVAIDARPRAAANDEALRLDSNLRFLDHSADFRPRFTGSDFRSSRVFIRACRHK